MENNTDITRLRQDILEGLQVIKEGLAELNADRLELFATGVEYGFYFAVGITSFMVLALWSLHQARLNRRLRNAAVIIVAGAYFLACLKGPDWLVALQVEAFETVETGHVENQDS